MEWKSKTFLLFADCILVKGCLSSIIYDLSRNDYIFIDNDLADFISKNEGVSDLGKVSDTKGILTDLRGLIDLEYAFICNFEEVERFPKLNEHWGHPAKILNATIKFKTNYLEVIETTIKKLNGFGCGQYQLISEDIITEDDVFILIDYFKNSPVEGVELHIPYVEGSYRKVIEELKDKPRFKEVVFHSSPINKIVKDESGNEIAYLLDQNLRKNDFVDFDYFSIGTSYFTEAKHHHTFFNRKIFIDSEGKIRRYFGDEQLFGNITDSNTSIRNLIEEPVFQKYWNANKDNTQICRNCEFRYMCFDSRLPFKKKNGMWAHEKSCNYNPYQALWAGEIGYQDTNEYYNKKG